MSESPVAIGISVFAAVLALFSFWYTTLRGPKIGPVGDIKEAKRTLAPDVRWFMDLTRIPFDIKTTIANSGARSGLIRKPNISFTQEPALNADLRVMLRSIDLKPQDGGIDPSTIENSVLLVPAYSVVSVSFGCSVGMMTWDRLPPKERFSVGCDLSKIHDGYFESKRQEALKVLSGLEQSRRLGSLSIELEVTERDLLGRFHWKNKVFLSSLDLAIAEEFSLANLKAIVGSWKGENQSNIYLSFLDYVENQGKGIRETLERKDPDATSISFPTATSEDHVFAKDTLCVCDPEFVEQWKKLGFLEGNWSGIITLLKEQKRGRQLSDHDKNQMRDLQVALDAVLQKCQVLRKMVVEDFKTKQ